MTDFDAVDFFRDHDYIADPYPYFEFLRSEGVVRREPHHDVVMVTGLEEAVEVYRDTDTYSSCTSVTGPFPGFPVPLDGDDVSAPSSTARARSRSSASSRARSRCS